MKKRIYFNKIKQNYKSNNLDLSTNINTKKNINIKERLLLAFKTFWLIILLLIGPSIIVSLFSLFININNSSLGLKTIISLISNLTIMLILFYIYKNTLIQDFKNFFNKNFGDNIEVSFKYWLAGFAIMYISNLIITIITNGAIAANEESVRELIDIVPLYMVFNVAIYAPFTEELIFRKSINDFVNNKILYILLSGLIFGGLHIISSLSIPFNPIDLLYLIPYSALGIAFAALYRKSNNIFSSMCMHALHNSIAIIIYLFL